MQVPVAGESMLDETVMFASPLVSDVEAGRCDGQHERGREGGRDGGRDGWMEGGREAGMDLEEGQAHGAQPPPKKAVVCAVM